MSFRSRLSSAHLIALVALFVALTSSATAAVMISGKNIKDGSVTGADVRDRSIAARDLAPDALAASAQGGAAGPAGPRGAAGADGADGQAGARGAKGDTGETGAKGNTGAKGDQGDRGPSNAYINAYDPSGQWLYESYTEVQVASVALPAGRFVVSGKNIVENFAGRPNFVQCLIYRGTDVVDWAWNREMPDQAQAPQAFAATVDLAAPATLTMRCKTGYASAHVRQAMLVATQVASITQG